MAEIPLQIGWNNFTGGMNDQKYQAPPGRFYKSFGLDTQRYDVTPLLPNELVFTYPSMINCIFNTEKVGGGNKNILWLNDGKIYENTTLVHTLTQGTQGYNIGYMKPVGSTVTKLYYFHQTLLDPKYIHRSNIDGSGFDQSYRTYSYNSDNFNQFLGMPNNMIIMNLGARIVFSYYNSIWQIDNNETVTKLIQFPRDENVVGITQFQGSFKVYTSTGFITSKLYTWDGSSSLPETSIELNGIFINSVVNDGAYDYMMTDNGLYQVAGVQYQQINAGTRGKLHCSLDGDILLSDWSSEINKRGQILRYGQRPGYGKGIHGFCIADSTQPNERITANIDFSLSYNYYSVFSKLFRNSTTTGNLTCFIDSLYFVGDNIRYEKSVDYIDLKFSAFAVGIIDLYVQINDSNSWIKIWSGNNTSISTTNSGLKIFKQHFLNPVGNFNKIRFKVEFVNPTNENGRFYGLDLYGKQDIGK